VLFLAISIALVLAVCAYLLAIAETAIRLNDEDSRSTDGIAFTRLVFVGLFGIVVSQSFTPGRFAWWIVAILSVLIVIGLVFTLQLVGRGIGKSSSGLRVLKFLAPVIKSINILFTPLSLPTEETEEFEAELIESVEELSDTDSLVYR
jgi:cytochrome bd-type quinol oxidase subunit 2